MPSGLHLTERFRQLDGFLQQWQFVWVPRPFVQRVLPWEDAFPAAAAWLRNRSREDADRLDAAGIPADGPETLRRWQAEARSMTRLPDLGAHGGDTWEQRLPEEGIRQRKRPQIAAFCRVVSPWMPRNTETVVDWCGGNGALGTVLAGGVGSDCVVIEKKPHLCRQALALGESMGVGVWARQADVLLDDAVCADVPGATLVALHACGILTGKLVELACREGARAVAAAPCCHHYLNRETWYTPLSRAGRESGLRLSSHMLRLSVLQDTVGSVGRRERRRREEAYRLGFDLLVRRASGIDRYQSPGRLPASLFRLPFKAFCLEAQRRSGLPLPSRWDAAQCERAGRERARVARALAVARGIFRRPLELWVALERALTLREAGFKVDVGTFCPADVTPRNILILAKRGD